MRIEKSSKFFSGRSLLRSAGKMLDGKRSVLTIIYGTKAFGECFQAQFAIETEAWWPLL